MTNYANPLLQIDEHKRIRELLIKALCRATGRSREAVEEGPLTCAVEHAKEVAELESYAAKWRAFREERESAARWKAGESLTAFPEFCGHWEGRPGGQGWYHVATGERWYVTAGEAMDAALKEKP